MQRLGQCPECGSELALEDAIEGELLPCMDCSAELEITCLDPLEVQLAPEVEEDWGE